MSADGEGTGPFLFLNPRGPRAGFRKLPEGGMCLSAFLFVRRAGSGNDAEEVLLGKYADDPRWERLAGLDEERWRLHGQGWTLPATHLRWGEHPDEAARRIAEDILGFPAGALALEGPRVEAACEAWERPSGAGEHYDLWFLYEAGVPPAIALPPRPPWYRALAWHDPRALPAEAWGRHHEDVLARWRPSASTRPGGARHA